MPNTLFRIAVALLAFGVGVTATTLWIAYRTPELKTRKFARFGKQECSAARPALPPLPTVEEPPPPPPPLPRAVISGGVLDGKAISKPQPAYPSIAVAARASGTVNVHVTVDESGYVSSAKAITGHPLLQQAAVTAAERARFSPTLLSGQPVKVSGVISYNFVLQ